MGGKGRRGRGVEHRSSGRLQEASARAFWSIWRCPPLDIKHSDAAAIKTLFPSVRMKTNCEYPGCLHFYIFLESARAGACSHAHVCSCAAVFWIREGGLEMKSIYKICILDHEQSSSLSPSSSSSSSLSPPSHQKHRHLLHTKFALPPSRLLLRSAERLPRLCLSELSCLLVYTKGTTVRSKPVRQRTRSDPQQTHS